MTNSSSKGLRAPHKHETSPARRPVAAQAQSPQAETEESRTPVVAFRYRRISAAVFEQPVQVGDHEVTVFNVSLRRSYRDGQGNWRSTHTLRLVDLPSAILALQKCYEHILTVRDDDEE